MTPALARFATMGIPIVPSPMNPTLSFIWYPLSLVRRSSHSRHGVLGVVQPGGTAYNASHMREYRYRVDREGRIFHDGTEIVDAATLRFFLLALQRTPDGRWLPPPPGGRGGVGAAGGPPLG